jgi:hypothetical protein
MQPDINKRTTSDGTIDADYTFGRPVGEYVSAVQELRLLLLKVRVDPAAPHDRLGPTLFKPC